jgi:hypothetical protein
MAEWRIDLESTPPPAEQAILEQARDRLNEKVRPDAPCPACGEADWAIGRLVNLPIGRGHPSDRIYICVTTFCGRCGYMRLFHVGNLGVDLEKFQEEFPEELPEELP